jgi:ABC-type multidrug transport system fused ATPase/permease subunit
MKNHAYKREKGLLRGYLRPYIGEVIVATILNIVLAAVTAVVGTLVGPGFKLLSGGSLSESYKFSDLFGGKIGSVLAAVLGESEISGQRLFDQLPLAILALASVKTSVLLVQWFLSERTGEKIARDIRGRLMASFLNVDPKSLYETAGENAAMELSTTITTDSKMLKDYFSRVYGGMPRELLQTFFTSVTLILLSKQLFFVFVLGVLPAGLLISRLGKKIRRRANQALNDYSLLTEWLQQRLLGIETIKHYGTEKYEGRNLTVLIDNLFRRFVKAVRAKARISPLMEAVAVCSIALVIYISFNLIKTGSLTGPIVLSFLSSLALMSQSAAQFGKYYSSMNEAGAAVGRIQAIFDFCSANQRQAVMIPVEIQKSGSFSTLTASELTVRYHSAAAAALADFSFIFSAPKIYCICGHSGAGKSTFANTVLGLRLPDQGHLHLAIPSGESAVYKGASTCYMPQDVLLLTGTILENVGYPEFTANEAQAWKALESVQMVDIIRELPHGIHTNLSEAGLNLSGGQNQRILLARLWYRKYGMILVDEGTSALDAELEAVIFAKLRQLSQDGTLIIMIAHRLTALQFSDELVLLNAGKLVASGSYQELKRSPEFSRYLGI